MQNYLSKFSPSQGVGLIIAVLVTVFVLMNREKVPINLFGAQVTGPAWVLLLVVFVAGWLVGVLATRRRLKRPTKAAR